MKINLKKYFEERDRLRALRKPDGPVVTFSRQFGCGSNKFINVFDMVQKSLNFTKHVYTFVDLAVGLSSMGAQQA